MAEGIGELGKKIVLSQTSNPESVMSEPLSKVFFLGGLQWTDYLKTHGINIGWKYSFLELVFTYNMSWMHKWCHCKRVTNFISELMQNASPCGRKLYSCLILDR